jgi:hypothetical protein
MSEPVEHDGRHFFAVLEHLGSEADRLGIRAVDAYGKPGSMSDFLDTVTRYVLAREQEIDQLRAAIQTAGFVYRDTGSGPNLVRY